ncbi:MAG: transcriptional regulator [Deltaproteobacteria bacterium]|nr:MAG: transcriptional regulator [Deltaproteobacteria bacterium]
MEQGQEKKSSAEPRLIKRYTNRKLYDTRESRYVTLEEISTMVKKGEEVQVVDNRSGEDLTEVTLAQILYEEQKKKVTRMPLDLLRDIIRSGGTTVSDFIQKRVTQPVLSFREEAERRVDAIVRRSEQTVEDSARQVREFIQNTQKALDDLQQRLGMRSVVEALGPRGPFLQQLRALRQRLEQLEARLVKPRDKD